MQETRQKKKSLKRRKIFFSRLKRRLLKHTWVLRSILIGVGIVAVYLLFLLFSLLIKRTQADYYLGLLSSFVFTPEAKIESIEGRTNILVLGRGGEEHEAPDLTDTIIFISVSHPLSSSPRGSNDLSVTMISLPRDIWIPELRTKLNSIYYWGNQKEEGGGIILAKSTVEQIVGQPVQYAAVIDFEGFKEIIDTLEGIEVEVERGFTDERYPIPGKEDDPCDGDPEFKCRYETVRFSQGRQLMDGETALKFVRSRNAEGDEGTDFARARRQRLILSAIKDKVLSKEILLSPGKISSLQEILMNNVETDIASTPAAILARRFFQARNSINSHTLPERFLERPPQNSRYDNLYVFIPEAESWEEVHEWVECVLENGECD